MSHSLIWAGMTGCKCLDCRVDYLADLVDKLLNESHERSVNGKDTVQPMKHVSEVLRDVSNERYTKEFINEEIQKDTPPVPVQTILDGTDFTGTWKTDKGIVVEIYTRSIFKGEVTWYGRRSGDISNYLFDANGRALRHQLGDLQTKKRGEEAGF